MAKFVLLEDPFLMFGRGKELPHSWQKRAMGLPGAATSGGQRSPEVADTGGAGGAAADPVDGVLFSDGNISAQFLKG